MSEHKPKDLPFVFNAICPKCKQRQVNEFGFRYCMDCGAPMRPPRTCRKISRKHVLSEETEK